MPEFDPVAFGRRIEEERKRLGWDLPTLQKKLAAVTNGAPGTSYGSVWSYKAGKAPQHVRREVVEGLAELFEVRPDYLLHGGGRTDFGAKVEAELEPDSDMEGFRERMFELAPFLHYTESELDSSVFQQALRVSLAFTANNRRLGLSESKAGHDEWEAALRFMNEYIEAPGDYWTSKHGRPLTMERETFSLYVEAALHALRLSLQAEVSTDSEEENDDA